MAQPPVFFHRRARLRRRARLAFAVLGLLGMGFVLAKALGLMGGS